MRSRRNRIDENLPQPMLSPMIDMIFLLLVFFIVSTMYMVELKTIPIKLPAAAHTEMVSKTNFIVTVKLDGKIFLNEEQITLADLSEAAKQAVTDDAKMNVVIRSDEKVEYGQVVKIMDALKGVGVTRFGLATSYQRQ